MLNQMSRIARLLFAVMGAMCVLFGAWMLGSPHQMRDLYEGFSQFTDAQIRWLSVINLLFGVVLLGGARGPLRAWLLVFGALSLIKGMFGFMPHAASIGLAWWSRQPDAVWQGTGSALLMLGAAVLWAFYRNGRPLLRLRHRA